jgi:hypothetical protein
MIDLALDVVGAVIGYFYAGELVSILGVKAVGVLAGFGVGSVMAIFLNIARGD